MVPLSLTGRILQTLVRLCCAHPALTVSMAFAFAALDTVASQEDLLADVAAAPTLDRLVAGINQSIGGTFLPGVFRPGDRDDPNTASARLLRDLLTQMSERIDGGPYRSPWANLIAAT